MKKILIPALLFVAAFFTGCNQGLLDIPQKGVISTESFYKTDADAEAAMVAAYQGFLWNVCSKEGGSIYAPYRATFCLPGDDLYAAGSDYGDNDFMRELNEFSNDPANEVSRNCYNNIYYAMYYCNLVIDYFKDGLPEGGPTPTTKRVVAEARVLRAWMHMMLAIGWGNPPLVDHILAGSDLPLNCDNPANENPMTHEQLLEWCAKECETAAADLDERTSPTDKNGAVKVTKGFAYAVAGKAYVFAGKYGEAKAALKKVIDSKKYELVSGDKYWQNFHVEGDCNEEKIFEANLETSSSIPTYWDIVNRSTWMESQIWGWRSDHFTKNAEGQVGIDPTQVYTGNVEGWGGLGIPKSFADEFVANDGEDSYRLKATMRNIEDVIYDTQYGDAAVDAMTRDQKKVSTAIGIKDLGLYGQSFYLPLKQLIRPADKASGNVRKNNFVIMRYAEVLLLYAEACVQTGDAASALPYINDIQRRAGSKTISTSVDMNVVKKEKKFEMWLEMCRWPDMVRWGDLELAKQAGSAVPVLYDKLTRKPQATDVDVIWQHGTEANSRFYTVSTHRAKDDGKPVGYTDTHKVFPYPDKVINTNTELIQNPGY